MYRLAYYLPLLFLVPQSAAALGLGGLEKHSELNEPFHATIDLVDANAAELDTLRVKLADAERFRRAGIERPHLLSQLRFEVVETGSGPDYIKITSQTPIQEPYLNFLIEVSWSNGTLFREYAALLDPPVYDRAKQGAARAPARVAPAGASAPGGSRGTASATRAATPGSYGPTASGDTLWEIALSARADRGLSVQQVMFALLRANPEAFFRDNINALKAGVVLDIPDSSAIAAISRSEAQALTSQHWALWEQYRGQVAARPARAPIGRLSSTAEAGDRVVQPGAESTPDTELKLLAANSAGAGAGDSIRQELGVAQETLSSQKQEIGELSSKLTEADEIIKLLRRQIDVKDAELAALQAKVAAGSAAGTPETEGAAAPPPETPATPEAVAMPPAAGPSAGSGLEASAPDTAAPEAPAASPQAASPQAASTQGESPQGESTNPEAPAATAPDAMIDSPETGTDGLGTDGSGTGLAPDAAEGATAAAEAPAVAPPPETTAAAEPAPTQPVAVETPASPDGGILEAIPGGAATVGIVIAATLGLAAAFTRRKRAAEVAPIDDDALHAAEGQAEPWDSAAAQNRPEDATVARIRPVLDEATGPVSALDTAGATPPADPMAEAEEDDALSDINVYLAYERFDEAEQVVKQAIAAQPGAHKLKLKLLEVYYAAGNNAAFEHHAAELQSAVAGTGPLWHSALAMWQAMSPERALFAPGGEPAPAASTGREFIDISAIGDTHKAPPSVLGEIPLAATQPGTTGIRRTLDALDLDFSSFGAERQAGGERMVDLTSGHELQWDGGGVGTAEPEAATGAVLDLGAGDDDNPEVLDLTIATTLSHPTILTGTTPHASTRSGATAETVPGNELRFGTVPGAGTGLDVDLSLGSGTADRGASLEATNEVTFKLPPDTDPGRIPAPMEVSVLGETIDLGAPEWPQASLRAGSAGSTAADGGPGSSMGLKPGDRTVEDSVEFDLGDIDLEVVESKTAEPIATAGVLGSSSFDVTQVSSIDLSLGSFGTIEPGDGLAPVDFAVDEGFSSDVDVKLNLAKAYIELGDAEGARAILQEVTQQGTAAERDEAAQLLDQIA